MFHVRSRCHHQPNSKSVICPCFPLFSFFANKFSAYWHRYPDCTLARGTLSTWVTKCPSTFHIYTPQDLEACPRAIILCRNSHLHAPPAPVKTPPPLITELNKLLSDMGWRLADATPWRLMLDTVFVHGLRNILGWESDRTPSLSDLHPSLANFDHLRRLINTVRIEKFPHGTGFEAEYILGAFLQLY
jgi:hypothetical protein